MFCLNEIKKESGTISIPCAPFHVGIGGGKRVLKKFVETYNKKLVKSENKLALQWITKVNRGVLAIFGNTESSNELSSRTTKSKRTSRKLFAVLLDNKNNHLIFYRTKRQILNFIKWWLRAKKRVITNDSEPMQVKSKKLHSLLTKGIKTYLIEVLRTEFGSGESIIIKSNKGKAMDQLDAYTKEEIVKPISVDNIKSVRLSIKGDSKATLYFDREGVGKSISFFGKDNSELPKEIQQIINERQVIFDTVQPYEILKNAIYKGQIENCYMRIPEIRDKVNNLCNDKLVKKRKIKLYFCPNLECDRKTPSLKRICKCGVKSNKGFEISTEIKIIRKNFIKKTRKLLNEINVKSELYSAKMLQLGRQDFAIKVNCANTHFYLYFSRNGLGKKKLQQIKTLGKPVIIIKFKGEVESNLDGLASEEGINFLQILINNDKQKLKQLINSAKEKSIILINEAFKEAFKEVKKGELPNPQNFENQMFSIFNYLFPYNQQLGGKKLADGVFGFKEQVIDFVLWDAKRYTKTKLADYVKQNSKPRKKFAGKISKDLNYMLKFETNKRIKKHGGLKYYLFVTWDTKKEDFVKAKEELQTQLKKTNAKWLKNKTIHISCVDKSQLIKLVQYLQREKAILQNNRCKFYKTFKKGLRTNNGYFEFDKIKNELEKITQSVYPERQDLQ
jgi:hypothetical protein